MAECSSLRGVSVDTSPASTGRCSHDFALHHWKRSIARQDGASNQLVEFDEVHLSIKKQQSTLGGPFCCDSLISLGFAGSSYIFIPSQSCEFRGSARQSVSATKGLSVFETGFAYWFSSMHQYHWELLYFDSSNCMHVCHFSATNGTHIFSYCTSVEVMLMTLLILFVKPCTTHIPWGIALLELSPDT